MIMITIAISRNLAHEHPEFTARCAERGHQVDVFDTAESHDERVAAAASKDDQEPSSILAGETRR